jgi:UDP-N-acetyl-2-amino-2-deoxyglucuronate dehydrogenase
LLTKWDVQDDNGEDAPIDGEATSGANDPMAISLEPFERQFRDLVSAHQEGREPLVGVREGFESLAVVEAIYESCRTGTAVQVEAGLESE